MKWFLATACAAALSMPSVAGADAKGCIKGAVVGAGHSEIGFGGRLRDRPSRSKQIDPDNANAQAPAQK
jgi:hypothetical protein